MAIDSSTKETIRKAIESISMDFLNECSQNEYNIDRDFAFDNMQNLKKMLLSLD